MNTLTQTKEKTKFSKLVQMKEMGDENFDVQSYG